MGGMKSTRWQGYQRQLTVEECNVITVPDMREIKNTLNFDIMEEDEYQGSITEVITISGSSEFSRFTFTLSAQRLGGYRYWFLCPGCTKRALKLYQPAENKEYLCRQCHHLSYRSSQSRH